MEIEKDELEYLVEGFTSNYSLITEDGKYIINEEYLNFVEDFLDLEEKDKNNIKKYFSCIMSECKVIANNSFSCVLQIRNDRIFIFFTVDGDANIELIAKDNNFDNNIHDSDIRKYIGSEFKSLQVL